MPIKGLTCLTTSRESPLADAYRVCSTSVNAFLSNLAHTQTDKLTNEKMPDRMTDKPHRSHNPATTEIIKNEVECLRGWIMMSRLLRRFSARCPPAHSPTVSGGTRHFNSCTRHTVHTFNTAINSKLWSETAAILRWGRRGTGP